MSIHKLPRVLIIETGGTIAQKRTKKRGVIAFRPSKQPVTKQVKSLSEFANYKVERLPELIDSTNMLTAQRAMLAEMIYQNAYKFDGFVIIHGTDTMADTAAALTFMVQDLGKPIVLTGSQLSIYEERTDAKSNVIAAVKTATQDYGEVAIVFGNGVYRGSRTIKDDEEGFNAFISYRTPPIGKVGITIEPEPHRIPRSEKEPRLFTKFDTNIGFIYPASGTSVETFTSQVKDPKVHGFVIVGFGAGNIPSNYYKGIEEATKLYKPIVVVTQCLKGAADMGIYEVGAIPLQLGAISGGDMTMQTATQKLMYALGKIIEEKLVPREIIERVTKIMHTNYAGEITVISPRF